MAMLEGKVIEEVKRRLGGADIPVSLQFWNGQRYAGGADALVSIRLNGPHALARLAKPTLGSLARAYVEQDIDIEGAARHILQLGDHLCPADASCRDRKGSAAWQWWRHTRARDRKNIQYHYDVSNDFYGLWLDQRRVYSCAYFRTPDLDLDAAQEAKLDHICRKLALKPGETLLDIGCGWGGLILHAAGNYGVRALGITLSDNQRDYALEQVVRRELQGRVEVRLMDYREVPEEGCYDKIASVGMFEHVGRRNLGEYFAKIRRLLKPGGLVMNHGITSAALDSRGLAGGISEFVDDYVFPGGELVHASEVVRAAASAGLECLDCENLRPHYGKTLWHWVERLEARQDEARRLIGEQKYRIWRIYMAGSAHAFERGWLELWQVLAGKGVGGVQPQYPYSRDHVYCA